MDCLMQLKKEGKIRAIGASNLTVEQIIAYRKSGILDAIQPRYSLLSRKIELNLLPYCHKHKISTLVYSPLEFGLLTGKIGMAQTFKQGEIRNENPWFRPHNRQRALNMISGWQDLTQKYACSLSQLAIAWTITQPGVTCALCGARKPEHAVENAAAGDIVLDGQDIDRMRRDVELLGKPKTA
jgi:methylglyoxal reductase